MCIYKCFQFHLYLHVSPYSLESSFNKSCTEAHFLYFNRVRTSQERCSDDALADIVALTYYPHFTTLHLHKTSQRYSSELMGLMQKIEILHFTVVIPEMQSWEG